MNSYIPSLRRELQKRVFIELAKPYTNVQLAFVEKVILILNSLFYSNYVVETASKRGRGGGDYC